MSAPIRTAVLGFGLAGKVFHCPFISAVPGLELSAIVQRHGNEAATAYPSALILRSIDDALADPNIDLIVVGTPNDTHFDLAARALQAGKHVVIDKPFAATSEQARELIAIAQKSGKIVAPFHNRRYDGDFLTVRKLRAENTLGRIVTIESHFDRFRPLQRANTWKEASGPANGMLFDLGPHLVDQALALFGPPRAIKSRRTTSALLPSFHITPKELRDLVLSFKSKTPEDSLVPPQSSYSPKKRDDSSIASSFGPNDVTLSGLPIGLYPNGDSPGRQGMTIAQVPAVPANESKYHAQESALVPPSTTHKTRVRQRKREQSNEANDVNATKDENAMNQGSPTTATRPSSDPDPLQASPSPEPANASSYLNFKDKTPESALVPPPEATP